MVDLDGVAADVWAFPVPDGSMSPELEAEDLVLVAFGERRPELGDVVLAVVDGEPMLRRLSVRDGVEVLTADRGRPGPEDAATAEILGVMVGVLRLKRRVLGVG